MPRLYQDVAGTIPAILPDQPVGLIQRAAGTVDVSQATAAAKPTLARRPKGGRRNLLPRNDWTVFPNGPVSGTFSISGLAFVDSGALSAGVSVDILGSGDDAGVPYIDARVYGTNGTGSTTSFLFRQNNAAAAQGDIVISARVRTLAGTNTGVRVAPGAQVLSNGAFVRGLSKSSEPFPLDAVLSATTLLVPPENQVNYAGTSVFVTAGATVDITIRISGLQLETGIVVTPPQKVVTANDITEAGVDDVWHLFFDGVDDALGVTLPAGTYGRARVSELGVVTVDSVTDPTSISWGGAARVADFMLRQGAFSAAEIAALTNYWEGLYK